jgi:hypothetical protein
MSEAIEQQNQVLRSRVHALEMTVRERDFEIARLKRAAKTATKLDPNAKDAFRRPWNGR